MSSPNSNYDQPSSPTLSMPCPRQQDDGSDRADALIQHRSNLETLKRYNRMGSFHPGLQNWIDYETPYVKFASNGRIIRLDAQRLACLKGPWIRPVCPHIGIECSEDDAQMELHLSQLLDGKTVNLFRATAHDCNFSIILPPEGSRPALTSASELACEPAKYTTDDGDIIFTPKRIVVAPANPRISPLHYYAAPTNSPRPLARKNRAASKRFLEFALYMSEARKSFDSAIVGEVRYRFETGFYEEHPDLHPAASATETHRILEPYDTKLLPRCISVAFQLNSFLQIDLVPLVREYLSPFGLPMAILDLLLKDITICAACLCVFSNQAYNSHLSEMKTDKSSEWRCKNSYSIVPVEQEGSHLSLQEGKRLRTFIRKTTYHADTMSYLRMPLAGAFISWNSGLGVPQDVWAVISTTSVECKKCHLARSYQGHLAHESFCSKTDWEQAKRELCQSAR